MSSILHVASSSNMSTSVTRQIGTIMVDALVAAGARPAAPGEFTYRAWRNGRLDLTRAEALDALVYTASHDLKTPVVNFQALLKMLRTVRLRPGSETMVEEIINRMEAAALKFQVTISDLLDVSRLEKQASDFVHHPANR